MSVPNLLNTYITVYRPTYTKDGSGSLVESLPLLDTYRTRVQPVSANENEKAGRKRSTVAYNFYLEVGTDIKMSDVIRYDSLYFDIKELNKYPNVYLKATGVQRD